MEPGDIVIGKRKIDLQKAKAHYVMLFGDNGTDWGDEITVYNQKEGYFIDTTVGYRKFLEKQDPELFEKLDKKKIHYSKVKGMIIDFDSLGEKRPHVNGLAAVLLEDKIWWIKAGDLQVVKLGRGMSR